MSKPKDLDIFARSLSGDWESRNELFKRFVWGNSRVRRLGLRYGQLDDFLHDCFTNLLRTGHQFNKEQDLEDWVESVSAWTALERQRLRDVDEGQVRLCAGGEGDEPDIRGRLNSYVPPRSGPEDSLPCRIEALVGETQFTILAKRARDGAAWEELAAAAGKPLNTIGPALVRAVDRLSRYFGAPPPLNDDLEPVFAWIVRQDAARHSDPSKVTGRMISMQLDPAFYVPTPEMRKIGLSVPTEVRTIVLWDAARASTPPGEALRDHLAKCHYCTDVLRALLLMQRALLCGPEAGFRLCPGAFTLLNTPEQTYIAFDRHLAECADCRSERDRLPDGKAPDEAQEAARGLVSQRAKKIAWVAIVLVLLGIGYLVQQRYSKAKNAAAPPVTASIPEKSSDAPTGTLVINSRYKDLAQGFCDGQEMVSLGLTRSSIRL